MSSEPRNLTDNEREFVAALVALSRKHKLRLHGCGCCGSPYIVPLKDNDLQEDNGYVVSPCSSDLCGKGPSLTDLRWWPDEFGVDRDEVLVTD